MPSFCADFLCHISFSSSFSTRGPVSSLWDKQRRSFTLSLQQISTQMVQTMRNFTTQLTLNQVIVCYYALDIAVLLLVVYLTKNKPQKLASNCVVGAKQCWGLEYFPQRIQMCPFSPCTCDVQNAQSFYFDFIYTWCVLTLKFAWGHILKNTCIESTQFRTWTTVIDIMSSAAKK